MCTYCIHTDLSTHKAVYVTVPEKAVIVYKIQIRTSKTVPYMHKYTLTERCVHFNPRDKNHFGQGKQYCTCYSMYKYRYMYMYVLFMCRVESRTLCTCKCGYQLGIRTYLTFGHRPCAVMCLHSILLHVTMLTHAHVQMMALTGAYLYIYIYTYTSITCKKHPYHCYKNQNNTHKCFHKLPQLEVMSIFSPYKFSHVHYHH